MKQYLGEASIVKLRSLLEELADGPRYSILLIVGVIVVRLFWAWAGHLAPLQSELQHVAVTLSHTGVIADAYQPGSGPTTHVGAVAPVLPAMVYAAFGVGTPISETILIILAATSVACCALILNHVFRFLDTPAWARGAALIVICFAPLYMSLEARDLRARETGWAAVFLALLILAVLRIDRAKRVRLQDALGLSALSALLFAMSPAPALAGLSAIGVLAVRRMNWRYWFPFLALVIGCIMLTSYPWALRNERIFGEKIWSRGNFGLEFAMGTYPAAVDPVDPAQTFRDRLATIHPAHSKGAYALMQKEGGEIAYSKQLNRISITWIKKHPGDALRIWLRHAKESYFPPAWLWNPYGSVSGQERAIVFVISLLAFMGLIGLVIGLLERHWQYLYVGFPVIFAVIPYILTQPRIRYRYIIASILVFLAFNGLAKLGVFCARLLRNTSDGHVDPGI